MTQFTPLHLAISEKLGWGDMLAEIALPAIQQILDNCAKECSMQIEEPVGYETLEDDILRMDGDDLFAHLIEVGDPREDYLLIVALRGEIEADMRMGFSYKTAIIAEYIN